MPQLKQVSAQGPARIVVLGCLSLVLLIAAGLKVASGHQSDLNISQNAYNGLAVAEGLAAIAVWTRWGKIVRWLIAITCLAGIISVLTWPIARCGCRGQSSTCHPGDG